MGKKKALILLQLLVFLPFHVINGYSQHRNDQTIWWNQKYQNEELSEEFPISQNSRSGMDAFQFYIRDISVGYKQFRVYSMITGSGLPIWQFYVFLRNQSKWIVVAHGETVRTDLITPNLWLKIFRRGGYEMLKEQKIISINSRESDNCLVFYAGQEIIGELSIDSLLFPYPTSK